MTKKRFRVYDDEFSKHIEDTYYTEDKHEHNLYDIWEMCSKLNELYEENEELKKLLECSREEANDYCEELMGKDTFTRLYERTIEELNIENERIKKVLNTHLNKSYVELNKFKSLKNPSNPERVRKQIIVRDAEIMLLIRILKEIDGSKSV